MGTIEQSIEVEVPVRAAYDQWTQFEEFPRFMEGVERDPPARRPAPALDRRDRRLPHEWDAEITEQSPDQRVAWRNTGQGQRRRRHVPQARRRAHPGHGPDGLGAEGVIEKVGDALGFATGACKGDLERFKGLIESRGTATGAWRGEVPREG